MKKCMMVLMMLGAFTITKAQVAQKKVTVDFDRTPAAKIPMEGALAVYDTAVNFKGLLTRDEVEQKLDKFFGGVFNSHKVYVTKTRNHYKALGLYYFCMDKKGHAADMYKVYYNMEIDVTGSRLKVHVSDFSIRNQNLEVSFQYLVQRARKSDIAAIKVLSFFHNNNVSELKNLLENTIPADGVASVTL